jgi:hypothetical protein
MITTKKERDIVHDLVRELDRTIEFLGACDHSVNICNCDLYRLRNRVQTLLDGNNMELHGSAGYLWTDRPKRKTI